MHWKKSLLELGMMNSSHQTWRDCLSLRKKKPGLDRLGSTDEECCEPRLEMKGLRDLKTFWGLEWQKRRFKGRWYPKMSRSPKNGCITYFWAHGGSPGRFSSLDEDFRVNPCGIAWIGVLYKTQSTSQPGFVRSTPAAVPRDMTKVGKTVTLNHWFIDVYRWDSTSLGMSPFFWRVSCKEITSTQALDRALALKDQFLVSFLVHLLLCCPLWSRSSREPSGSGYTRLMWTTWSFPVLAGATRRRGILGIRITRQQRSLRVWAHLVEVRANGCPMPLSGCLQETLDLMFALDRKSETRGVKQLNRQEAPQIHCQSISTSSWLKGNFITTTGTHETQQSLRKFAWRCHSHQPPASRCHKKSTFLPLGVQGYRLCMVP